MDAFMKIWPILAFMVVQTIAAVWWASKMDEKVRRLEEDVEGHNGLSDRISKMEGKLDAILDALKSKRGRA
jgi:hypothetical protein